MARELIAWYVSELGLPHPQSLDCHECAESKAKEYAMYVYPVCRFCRKEFAFVLGDIKTIAHLSPKLKKKQQLAAGIQTAQKLLQDSPAPIDGEYLKGGE